MIIYHLSKVDENFQVRICAYRYTLFIFDQNLAYK